jgi:F-type H+-transporting ATPase subunit alpha
LERAARLADRYVLVPKSFTGNYAELKDAVDEEVYGGPLALHSAEEALKGKDNPEDYKAVQVSGSGGSLTALPIIETLLGDVSAYIPTNVISITDGQIYLESNLFYAGIRPAINVGISVSRVGGDAQTRAMRQVAGRLRLDMAAYRDLAAFAQFGSDLDKATQAQLNRGQHLQEILKQPQYEPMSIANQVMEIFAGTQGYTDDIPIDRMDAWENEFLRFMETSHPEVGKAIADERQLSPETEEKLRKVINEFMKTWK